MNPANRNNISGLLAQARRPTSWNGVAMLRALTCFTILLLAACSQTPPAGRTAEPVAHRIVSLVPSFTEDLFAIGAGAQVVGVSAYSDFPAAAKGLPQISDYASIDTERVVLLHPDAIVAIASQGRLVDPIRRLGIRVRTIPDDSYADIFTSIRQLGILSGHRRQAERLIAKLRRETALANARTRAFKRRPSVYIALGTEPLYTAGPASYIGQLIALAGGRDAAADLTAAYGEYSAEALLRAQPDAIVGDIETNLASVLGREPWRSLTAVRAHRVYILPDSDWLYRPGPRYPEGLEWLIERLKPLAST